MTESRGQSRLSAKVGLVHLLIRSVGSSSNVGRGQDLGRDR